MDDRTCVPMRREGRPEKTYTAISPLFSPLQDLQLILIFNPPRLRAAGKSRGRVHDDEVCLSTVGFMAFILQRL